MQYIALIVIILSLIAIAYRDIKIAFISLGAILLAALLFYYLSPNEHPGRKSEQVVANIELQEKQISTGYANGFVLDLRIHNNNRDKTLQTLTILSRLSDCEKDHSNCLIIGEEKNVVKLRIPPGQARDVKINLRIKQINPIQGVAFWEHQVVGIR